MKTRTIEMTIRITVRRATAEEIGEEIDDNDDLDGIEDDELDDFARHYADGITAIDQAEIMAGSDCLITAESSSLVTWREI